MKRISKGLLIVGSWLQKSLSNRLYPLPIFIFVSIIDSQYHWSLVLVLQSAAGDSLVRMPLWHLSSLCLHRLRYHQVFAQSEEPISDILTKTWVYCQFFFSSREIISKISEEFENEMFYLAWMIRYIYVYSSTFSVWKPRALARGGNAAPVIKVKACEHLKILSFSILA